MSWNIGERRFGDIKPKKGDRLLYLNHVHLIYDYYNEFRDEFRCREEKTNKPFIFRERSIVERIIVNVTQENWEFDNCPVQYMFKKEKIMQRENNGK